MVVINQTAETARALELLVIIKPLRKTDGEASLKSTRLKEKKQEGNYVLEDPNTDLKGPK